MSSSRRFAPSRFGGGRCSALLLPLLALAVSGSARAANTLITFDDINAVPGGPPIALTNQYAAQGVVFENGFVVASDTALTLPNVAAGYQSGELNPPYVRAHFTVQNHSLVTVQVENNGAGKDVTLSTFDAAGNFIARVNGPRTNQPGTYLPLTVATNTANIAAWVVTGENAGPPVMVDDLRFDDIGAVQPPDISLYPIGGYFTVVPGGPPTIVNVNMLRIGGSKGGVTLSAAGLPAGVSIASVTPNPVNGTTAQIAFRAAGNARAVQGVPVRIDATPGLGAGAFGTRSTGILMNVADSFDALVNGIEVTQGIQNYDLPQRDRANPKAPVSYNSVAPGATVVPLAQDGLTAVRVFVDLAAAPKSTGLPTLFVTLSGFRDGQPLPGSPLNNEATTWSAPQLGADFVTDDQRAGKKGGVAWFTLPREWTKGTITLTADLHFPPSFTGATGFDCCSDNNSFTLTDVAFTPTRGIFIAPFRLDVDGQRADDPPSLVFKEARNIAPIGQYQFNVGDWAGSLNITDIWNQTKKGCGFLGLGECDEDGAGRAKSVASRLRDRADDLSYTDNSDLVIGVVPESGGQIGGVTSRACTGAFWDCDGLTVAVVQDQTRPLSAVAHELGHMLGRVHASGACNASDTDSFGPFEGWPKDEMGFLQGVGFDRRTGRVLFPPRDGSAPNFWDYMSYCGTNGSNDPDHWISVKGWLEEINSLAVGKPGEIMETLPGKSGGARVLQANPTTMIVRAFTNADGFPTITKVGPAGPRTPIAPVPASPFHLVTRDDAGNVLSDVGMRVEELHSHIGPELSFLSAQVPDAGVKSIEIVSAGAKVAARIRSAHAPEVAITNVEADMIRAGVRSSRVTWTATDMDGDALMTKVDYSADGGKTWTAVSFGPNTGEAILPNTLLSTSATGMIAIRVTDGFNETMATSAPFATSGSGPDVQILAPETDGRFKVGATINLAGTATDDAGKAIPDANLLWYDGDALLGSGAALPVSTLTVGTHTVRLTATDAQARTRTRTVTIQIER